MSGHVFHPGHHELHGITVVLETTGSLTYAGRFDREDEAGVHLLNVGVVDAAAGAAKEEFLRRCATFGIRVEHRHLVVPSADVSRITRLVELA
jgi:hypothetical protein